MWLFRKKVSLVLELQVRVAGMESGEILTKTGRRFSYSSRHRLISALRFAVAYQQQTETIYLHQVDDEWMDAFTAYIFQYNLKKNTVFGYIKSFMQALKKICKKHKMPYLVDEYQLGQEITTQVYTSVSEIEALLKVKYGFSGYDKIRDLYVMQAFMGLRYGDFRRLMLKPKQYLVEDKFFRIQTEKSETVVVIPIAKRVREILDAHSWNIKPVSIQLYNRRLKKVAEVAGLTQEVVVHFTRKGKKCVEIKKKYELMSSHTARRSFATNAYLAGIPTLKIRQITGHSTETSFLKYIRSDSMESASTIVNDPFFL